VKIQIKAIALAFALVVISVPAFAQIDLTGSWTARMHEDWMERCCGRDLGDYTGLPINDEARAKALSWDASLNSLRERQCLFFSPWAGQFQPQGIRIWSETDANGRIVAWKLSGNVQKDVVTIWMDGRPHPSKYAPHEKSGFTTGVWEDDVLVTYTTHMEAGAIRRNGVPSSDQATMTARFSRHDDVLTITARIDDPIYLTEPYYLTRSFALTRAPLNPATHPCTVTNEGIEAEQVPHYLPGQHPFIDELPKLYGIPQEAVLGGAETALPEFRKKIKDKYVRPSKCVSVPASTCGGPGTYPPLD